MKINRRQFNKMAGIFPLMFSTIAPQEGASSNGTLSCIEGLKVGHYTDPRRPTGVTVVLASEGAVAGVDVRGSAPGTRETDLLNPVNTVQKVHAIVLAGGSAFGLDAATGVVRFLEEEGIGYETSAGRVPIVPAAILFDLRLGDPSIRPDQQAGYKAARQASSDEVKQGSVGAGAGATVGKLRGMERAMKSGLGSACITLGSLKVAALAVANSVGDIIDPANGRVVAGVRTEDGKSLADARSLLLEGVKLPEKKGENTTLAVVATNAAFDKAGMTKMAQMAQDGLARSIYPAHTPFDGDTVFALSTGKLADQNLGTVGALAAEATSRAILAGVKAATAWKDLPAWRDFQ